MPYDRQQWANGDATKPLSADRLNHLEMQYDAAVADVLATVKTFRNGTGAPTASLGVDGDFYLDTAASRLYGPKTAGAWGSGVSLIGPPGQGGGTTVTDNGDGTITIGS